MFVHTEQMKRDLCSEFSVPANSVSVVPFGINSTVPDTKLSRTESRGRLGLNASDPVLLFFGNIAPYKGLEYLVEALAIVIRALPQCRLVIAGRPKGSEQYWAAIERQIESLDIAANTVKRIEYIPDAETEIYFKAADVLVLPYVCVFQSGVLVLGYNFGLPVVTTDVASLKDDVLDGKTGFTCDPGNPTSLAKAIKRFFASDLYRQSELHRDHIKEYARNKYSWSRVAEITSGVYSKLLAR
jgi:glycosyltransferase involved in cell wall biosynthesis